MTTNEVPLIEFINIDLGEMTVLQLLNSSLNLNGDSRRNGLNLACIVRFSFYR
ncbi:hypothetical protein ABER99_21385 [Paenibacillus glucanolyticus]|uniref:hypothetical protein n=2 Tax=Paenibacillus TaxID=44249 RepID=UPI0013E2B92B|nr:hypothetical protein [Paenibacillus glucanolyticus]